MPLLVFLRIFRISIIKCSGAPMEFFTGEQAGFISNASSIPAVHELTLGRPAEHRPAAEMMRRAGGRESTPPQLPLNHRGKQWRDLATQTVRPCTSATARREVTGVTGTARG